MTTFRNKSSDPRLQAYTAVRQIGKGSYGEVFLVKNSREKKQYVMKNIKLTASSAKERLAAEQEAVLLGQLQHPNIVSYKESFQDEHGMLHIVMGYCEGGDLCTRLKSYKGQYLSETQVVEWFVQIALGLQYLHERNILHRDLKTQNIFLSKNDIIKVGDLGIARVLDGSCDLAHTVIGTPYYMSPELFANEPYNHKSDVWALGCCVYEMATLQHAFTANNLNALMYKIIKGKVPALPPTFSGQLSELIHGMLAHEAEHRPSVHQLLRNTYVRTHIKLFLDRTAGKRRTSTKLQKTPTEVERRGRSSSAGKLSTGSTDKRAPSLPRTDSSNQPGEDNPPLTDPSSQPIEGSVNPLPISEKVREDVNKGGREGRRAVAQSPQKASQQKKPPRPLPPDPVPKSDSSKGRLHPLVRKVSSNESIGVRGGAGSPKVSSARERRRKSKQHGSGGVKGRVVLRSRSSSDLSQREKSGGPSRADSGSGGHSRADSGSGGPSRADSGSGGPSRADSGSEGEGGRQPASNPPSEREGISQPSSDPPSEEDRGRLQMNIGEQKPYDVVDGPPGEVGVVDGPPGEVSVVDGPPEEVGVVDSPSGEVNVVDGPPGVVGVVDDPSDAMERVSSACELDRVPSETELRSGSSNEVDEFITLLDTTLHLPEPPVRVTDHPRPAPQQAFTQHQSCAVGKRTCDLMVQSGRLGDRIVALRRECEAGLGSELMRAAALILDQNDPEEAEELLLRALGKELFDKYAGKLQHLSFCEDNVRTV